MATGGGYPSLSKTSEEIFDSECFNCSQDGKHVEAAVFCVECGNNMCQSCLKDHNRFPQLRNHHIKDKSVVKLGTTHGALPPPSEKCTEHDGRLIDTYCSRHDAVCCSVCVSENHRSCPDVSYIPKVASGISTSKELQDAQTNTKTLKTRLDTLKETREETLEDIRKQRNEALERAAIYKDELIERIEELGKKTAADIIDKYKQLEDTISGDLDELSKLIEALDAMDGKLKIFSDDETKLFVHLKTCKQYISAGEKLEKTCSPPFGPDTFTFDPDLSIETYVKRLTAIGNFVEDTNNSDAQLYDGNIKAVHLSNENIKSSADTETCRITGICSLEDGGLMIVDFRNNCLKKLDKSFQIESRCALSSRPWDVCQTGATEVAVTMWEDKKVQFVSVGQSLSLTRSFKTGGDDECTGIEYFQGKLYVSRPNGSTHSVQVYDISGTLLQTIQKDKTDATLFDIPLHIAVSARTSNIYVTDFHNGLIILDKSGQLVTRITDPDLRVAYGVCVLPGDQLLVCGRKSDNIIQFDARGKKVRTLLTSADGLKSPETLYFDPGRSRLIVGMERSDTIKSWDSNQGPPDLKTNALPTELAGQALLRHGVYHPPSEICTEHDGRLIDTYCSSHDVVCCSVCVSENHRACPDISNIPEVASGISTSKELQDAQSSTMTLTTRLDTDTNYLDAHLLDGNIMAVHLSDANIKSSADMKPCRITGICSLEGGGMIIADFENSCLKKLDMSFKMESRWYFSGGPWDMCQIGSTEEVAVTMLKDKMIQFVSVGQALSLTRSFTLSGDDECSGIAYSHGQLYVSRPNGNVHSVQVYDISGALLQTIQKDKTGKAIFDIPLHIAVSALTSNLYVTDYSKGLIIMDKSGQLVTMITNPDLEKPYGVCVLPRDQLLVCGRGSDNIIHFDAQGQKVRTLLTDADGLKYPETLHVDPERSLLIVGMLYSDTIKVYSLVNR